MQELRGQEELVQQINAYTLQTWPKALLFIGPIGSGKHTLCTALINKFDYSATEINDKITAEDLADFYTSVVPRVYIIDLSAIQEKQQNQFLKFIEEPPASAHVILLAESEFSVLPTILNRCTKLFFKPYTKAILHELFPDFGDETCIIYDICNTPGQLINASKQQILSLYGLCDSVIHNVNVASYANTLKLVARVNYKEEYDKFDFEQFLRGLVLAAFNSYIQEENKLYFTFYTYFIDKRREIMNKTINKEAFMLNLLSGLWELAH